MICGIWYKLKAYYILIFSSACVHVLPYFLTEFTLESTHLNNLYNEAFNFFNRAIQTCLLDLLDQFLRLGNIRLHHWLHEFNYVNSSLTVVKRQCEQRGKKPTTEIVPFCTIYVHSKRKRNDFCENCAAFLPVLNLAFLINLIYNKHF